MTIYREFSTYCDLLAQDVEDLSPATMATISGFGRFGEYDPTYLEIREDVLQCVDLVAMISPDLDLGAASETRHAHLHGRDLNEANLRDERAKLVIGLDRIRDELQRLSEERFCILWTRVPAFDQNEFIERLEAAGLGATAHDAPAPHRAEWPVRPPAQARSHLAPSRRGRPIYLSSFFEQDLARQIIPTLREFGMRPVALPEKLREGEVGLLRQRLSSCEGGVLRLSEHDRSGEELEIREGLKHFPKRLLIISEPHLLQHPPLDIEPRALFPVSGAVMSPSESIQFASLLSNTL